MTSSSTTKDKRTLFEESILPRVTSVTRTVEGGYLFKRAAKVLKQYTRYELMRMEPRLCVFIDKPVWDVKALKASWSFWNDPLLPVYKWDSTNTYAITHIRSISKGIVPHYDHNAVVHALKCNAAYYQIALFGDIWFATGHQKNKGLTFTQSWLETAYPGAMTRIRLAQELELTPEEVATYAVNVGNAVVPAALPVDVCFDVDVCSG